MRGVLLLFAAVLVGILAFPTSKTLPAFWGVNIHFTNGQPGELNMLAAGGFSTIRMDLDWATAEKQAGVYNFDPWVQLVQNAKTLGINVLLILDYGNPLYDGGLAPYTPAGIDAFVKYATNAVAALKGNGVIWEMWNEPNGNFWLPRANVTAYIELATAVGKALKSQYPDEILIGPATSGVDLTFIEAVLAAGVGQYFDAVSVHPYFAQNPEFGVSLYAQLHTLISKYVPKPIPAVCSEWGYTTTVVDEDTQAKYLQRIWLFNLVSGFPLSVFYDWHDDGTNSSYTEDNFGTVEYPYQNATVPYIAKPSYLAAKTLTTQLKGCNFTARLDPLIGEDTEYVLKFACPSNTNMLVVWTSQTDGGEPVEVGDAYGCYEAVEYLGAKHGKLCAKGGILPVLAVDTPLFLSQQI